MAKRWTAREDRFIHAYLDSAVSAKVMAMNDLQRSAPAIKDRARFLRESGAWDALTACRKYEEEYYRCVGYGEFDVTLHTIRR